MKPAIVALLLAFAAAPAATADERNPTRLFDPGNHVDANGVVRDSDGRALGHIDEGVKDSRVLRDNAGRHIGSVEPGFGEHELVIRNSEGRRQGTLERR